MADLFPVAPANAPPASYADFAAAQRSLFGAGMLPTFNVSVGGPQLPGGAQDAQRGAALSALPGMVPSPPAPTTPKGGGGRNVGGNLLHSLFGAGAGGPGFGHQVPAPRSAVSAPAAPVASSGGAPPETGGAMVPLGGGAPPEIGSGLAAPNVIQGGVPGATTPSEVPGMLHPADHAIAYAQHLAAQREIQPYDGTNGNEFTTLGPNSPRMDASASPAAVNVIRAGVPDNGGGGGRGINAVQLSALMPLLAGQQAARLDPAKVAQRALITHTQREQDANIALQDALARHDVAGVTRAQNALTYMQSKPYMDYINRMRVLGFGLPGIEAGQVAQNVPAF